MRGHFFRGAGLKGRISFFENKLEKIKKTFKLILKYMMYRGSKAGKKDFIV
jgi:hypothetical protein